MTSKQVSKVVPQRVPKQEEKLITGNSLINLIIQTSMNILCEEIVKINEITSKAQRP
jgi:hypothetical protein